jgi:hypothetical protein
MLLASVCRGERRAFPSAGLLKQLCGQGLRVAQAYPEFPVAPHSSDLERVEHLLHSRRSGRKLLVQVLHVSDLYREAPDLVSKNPLMIPMIKIRFEAIPQKAG